MIKKWKSLSVARRKDLTMVAAFGFGGLLSAFVGVRMVYLGHTRLDGLLSFEGFLVLVLAITFFVIADVFREVASK